MERRTQRGRGTRGRYRRILGRLGDAVATSIDYFDQIMETLWTDRRDVTDRTSFELVLALSELCAMRCTTLSTTPYDAMRSTTLFCYLAFLYAFFIDGLLLRSIEGYFYRGGASLTGFDPSSDLFLNQESCAEDPQEEEGP